MAKVDLRVALISLILTVTAACSGSGNGPSVTPTYPMMTSGGMSPTSARLFKEERRRTRIALDKTGKALKLPPTASMSERITLPANDAPPGASLEVIVSNALPRPVSRLPARKGEAFMSFTLEASVDVTLRGIPKFSVKLPSAPANRGGFYAWAFSPQSGWRDFGPMTVYGNVLTFGGGLKNVKLQRGIGYAVIPFTAAESQGCPPGAPLFVANAGSNAPFGSIAEYAPPYTGAPIATISKKVNGPFAVAVSASGNLFVANNSGGNITEYAPPYTGAPIVTISNGVAAPQHMAFNPSGNLFVSSFFSTVTEWAPPYTGAPIATISNSINSPSGVAFNASSNLFVANINNVTEYAPPYTGAPIATISNSLNLPHGVAFNSSGNLFVANGNNTITEYAPPYTGAPIATITNSIDGPNDLAFNLSGNLFVANGNNTITEYAPPYTGAPLATITNSVDVPFGLAFGPELK